MVGIIRALGAIDWHLQGALGGEGGSPALPALCFPSAPRGSGCEIIELHRLFLRAPLCCRHKLEHRQCLKFMFWLSVTSYISVLSCPRFASVFPFWVEIFQPRSQHKGGLRTPLNTLWPLQSTQAVERNISMINIPCFFSFLSKIQNNLPIFKRICCRNCWGSELTSGRESLLTVPVNTESPLLKAAPTQAQHILQ